uniref:NB-ARC domain-containing protein n=1 Tax=Oryza punctata TaxID=4537 RepID=A0A0E0MLC8_ORYPU
MESTAAIAFTKSVVGKLLEVLDRKYKMLKDLSHESASMQNDLLLLAASMDDQLRQSPAEERPTALLRAYTELMRELTHDMEDAIERFLHRVTCEDGAPWPRRAAHWVRTLRTRLRFAAEIRQLKRRLVDAPARLSNIILSVGGGSSSSAPPPPARVEASRGHVEPNPVGMEEPIEHLVQLLDEPGGGPQQLRVIAIVGFRGSGKTTLARAVYGRSARQFRERAWVDASKWTDVGDLLADLVRGLCPGDDDVRESHEENLRNRLKNKGYLIVLDDINMEQWNAIESIFENNGRGSRVIVTTAVQSVANSCTAYKSGAYGTCLRRHGRVYKMPTLGEAHAKELALGGERPPELEHGSATLMAKCDGHPLALVCVANHLRCQDNPTGRHCADLCHRLGSLLLDERNAHKIAGRAVAADSFARLRRVLMDSYAALPDYAARTCLLYLAVFPNGRPLKRSVLVRRWLAEGYARGSDDVLGNITDMNVADGHFWSFVDQSIIVVHPDPAADDDAARDGDHHAARTRYRCRTHGIMHEFVLHKSMAENFISSSRAPPPRRSKSNRVRHLSIHGGGNTKTMTTLSTTDLSRVRSLTVFGDGGDAVSNIRKYKLLRVLDLEHCTTGLNDDHLAADICRLWNLRYLSLGSSVTTLPDKIRRLKLLQTIHLSYSKVTVLPLQVIGLPCLAHLIGKFKLLPDQHGKALLSSELEELAKKSNLETLAGFVADENQQSFPRLMRHMTKLNKIKIWCEFGEGGSSASVSTTDHLADAIKSYMAAPKVEETDARSLSIDMEQCSKQLIRSCHGESKLLHSLKPPCRSYLTSLKLHGDLFGLHGLISLLKNLYELCLSSTTLTKDLVSVVGTLPLLLRLKLIANHIEYFTIETDKFRSLQHLLLVVKRQSPILPKIELGALQKLVSLELLCKHLSGLSGIQIRHLERLKDIALDSRVSEETKQAWEAEARSHPNRPSVLLLNNRYSLDDQTDDEPARNAANPDELAPEPDAPGPVESENSTIPLGNLPSSTLNSSVAPKESSPDAVEEGLGRYSTGLVDAHGDAQPTTTEVPSTSSGNFTMSSYTHILETPVPTMSGAVHRDVKSPGARTREAWMRYTEGAQLAWALGRMGLKFKTLRRALSPIGRRRRCRHLTIVVIAVTAAVMCCHPRCRIRSPG